MNRTYGWFTAAEIYDSVYNTTSGTSSTKNSNARDGVRWALSRGVTGTRRSPLDNVSGTPSDGSAATAPPAGLVGTRTRPGSHRRRR